jgi:hypothetical protein
VGQEVVQAVLVQTVLMEEVEEVEDQVIILVVMVVLEDLDNILPIFV